MAWCAEQFVVGECEIRPLLSNLPGVREFPCSQMAAWGLDLPHPLSRFLSRSGFRVAIGRDFLDGPFAWRTRSWGSRLRPECLHRRLCRRSDGKHRPCSRAHPPVFAWRHERFEWMHDLLARRKPLTAIGTHAPPVPECTALLDDFRTRSTIWTLHRTPSSCWCRHVNSWHLCPGTVPASLPYELRRS